MKLVRSPLIFPALGLTVWLAALTVSGRGLVIDEWIHLGAIEHLASGRPGLPPGLAMLPGYHWIMSWPYRWFGEYVVALREINLGFALLGLWAYAGALRASGRDPGPRTAQLVWLPILFPFLTLIYTEAASLAAVMGALWCHTRQRYAAAAGMLLLAALVRQSNLVWAILFLGWVVVEDKDGAELPGPAGLVGRMLRAGWPYLVLLGGGLAFLMLHGPVATVRPETNVGYNPAQLVMFGLFLGLVTLPLLVTGGKRPGWPWWLGAAGLTALFGLVYANPHPFNQTPDLWRNRILIAMDSSPAVRWILCAASAAVLAGLGRWMAARTRKRGLVVWAGATLCYLAPHSLVEPRYYILPIAFLGFLAEIPPARERALTLWCGALTFAECCVLLAGGPLW